MTGKCSIPMCLHPPYCLTLCRDHDWFITPDSIIPTCRDPENARGYFEFCDSCYEAYKGVRERWHE